MADLDFHPLIKIAHKHFAMKGQDSLHGLGHWGRVLENGMRLAPLTGADPQVVALFAIFHDCKRENDGADRFHGPRAAKFIYEIAPYHLGFLNQQQVGTLAKAVAGHTNCRESSDPTLGTCWDADRLDIPRIGSEDNRVLIDPYYLSTNAAKTPEILDWAQERAEQARVPTFVTPHL